MAETWLSYTELADRLGITPEAARAKSRRMHWRRQIDNNGLARILFDPEAMPPARTRPAGHQPDERPVTNRDAEPAPQATLAALEGHIATLKDQLAKAEAFAAERGHEVARERERVADLTAQLLRITGELLDARKADQRPRSWWRRLAG